MNHRVETIMTKMPKGMPSKGMKSSKRPMSPIPHPKENPMARSGGTLVLLGRAKSTDASDR